LGMASINYATALPSSPFPGPIPKP
jgi:hypothetical protein